MSAPAQSAPTLLAAHGLGKAFPVANGPRQRLGALLRLLAGRPIERSWAIRGVDFAIQPGASLGVIGENGAGKSTLLKLLVGVLTPSEGSLQRSASVGALLELGAGFDAERSGRANIALSAGLMGWSAAEIRQREEEILAFADIGEHIDAPVKHYSSGMVVRLGFAIIAAVRPALLITDEVLAVGDESFQKKCIRWIESYLAEGGTLLLVSHSMYHVQKLCKHALWLRDGKVEAYGEVFDVTQSYLAFHERKSASEQQACGARGARELFEVTAAVLDGQGGEATHVMPQPGRLVVEVELFTPDEQVPHLCLGIERADGTPVFNTSSEIDGAQPSRIDPHHLRYRLQLDLSALLPGHYMIHFHPMDSEAIRLFSPLSRGLVIRGQSRQYGLLDLPRSWG